MVLPSHCAPAANSCSTHTAETLAGGCVASHVGLPQPVRWPATSMRSLTANRNPRSGPSFVAGSVNFSMNAPDFSREIVCIVDCYTGLLRRGQVRNLIHGAGRGRIGHEKHEKSQKG